jgi:hypothetical protein
VSAFRAGSTPTAPSAPGRWSVSFPSGWLQGRGVYGGLSAAAVYHACRATVAPGLSLRTMSLQYLAPVAPGAAEIEVDEDRSGTGTTFLVARLRQQGAVQVHALATFGRGRPADLDEDTVTFPPDVPPPGDVPVAPHLPGLAPEFLQHLELRFAGGALPFSGAREARVGAWLRLREPPDALGVGEVLGMLDTPPPGVLVRATTLRPASTVSFHVHLFRAPPPDPAPPWYIDVTSRITVDGWSDEEIRLFAPDRRIVAVGRQLVAILR